MSIGVYSALLNLSAKLFVRVVYSVRTPQVQQVVVAVDIVLLPMLAHAAEPQPGTLIPAHVFAEQKRFADWEFGKKVWWEMETRQQFDAEWTKYAPEFEAWLELYRQNPYKAKNALKEYPKDKRQRILRGHDMQLAYDDWWNQLYSGWRNAYENDLRFGRAKTFPELLKRRMANGCSGEQNWISDCGGPDWRTEAMKAEDEAMMQSAAKKIAEEKARRAAKPVWQKPAKK